MPSNQTPVQLTKMPLSDLSNTYLCGYPVHVIGNPPPHRTACTQVLSGYINALPFGVLSVDPVLAWCFSMHPRYEEKRHGLQVIGFEKIHHFASYALFALLSDGTKVDFAYAKGLPAFYKQITNPRKCKVAEDGLAKKAKHAFRKCILSHMREWGAANQASYSKGDVVDHAYPNTFNAILMDFISQQSLLFRDINLEEADASSAFGYIIADPVIESKWIEFHNSHANYRWLPAKINMSFGCRDPMSLSGLESAHD